MNKLGRLGQSTLLFLMSVILAGCQTGATAVPQNTTGKLTKADTHGASKEAVEVGALFIQDTASEPAVEHFYNYFKNNGKYGQICANASDQRRCELDAYPGGMNSLWKCVMPTVTVAIVMAAGTLRIKKDIKIRHIAHSISGYSQFLTRVVKQYQVDPVDKITLEKARLGFASEAKTQTLYEQIQITRQCMIHDQKLTRLIGKGAL